MRVAAGHCTRRNPRAYTRSSYSPFVIPPRAEGPMTTTRCPTCGRPTLCTTIALHERRARLRYLMRTARAVSQPVAARLLGVTQVTICRDLRALGATRRMSNGVLYWTLRPQPEGRTV